MKRIILFAGLIALAAAGGLKAQITVTQADMPIPGDTLRVSLTNIVPAGYAAASMDTSWNFSMLEPLSQRLDTFVSVTTTPPVYQLLFVLTGGANLASPLGGGLLPGVPVSQGFSFYKNNASGYSDLGSAYTVQGLPLPLKYDVPDKLYQFPMTPGLSWNSASGYEIALSGMGYYGTQRVRSSVVDGWGPVTTPFGTFQSLRVKSDLVIHDSIYIDSMATGFPVDRVITEYKWLAAGKGIPVLQINEEAGMATAIYRDIYRLPAQQLNVSIGPDTAVNKGAVITMRVVVSGGVPPYRILWNTLDTGSVVTAQIQTQQTFSVLVADAVQNIGTAQRVVSVIYPPGFSDHQEKPLAVYPNPSSGTVRFRLPDPEKEGRMQVIDGRGIVRISTNLQPTTGLIEKDLSGLPEGFYLVRLTAGNESFSARVSLIRNRP